MVLPDPADRATYLRERIDYHTERAQALADRAAEPGWSNEAMTAFAARATAHATMAGVFATELAMIEAAANAAHVSGSGRPYLGSM